MKYLFETLDGGVGHTAGAGALERTPWQAVNWMSSSRQAGHGTRGASSAQIAAMGDFLRAELAAGRTLPAGRANVLRAFQQPFADVRVLIVGQDPVPDARATRSG